jgi:predicted permease
MFSNVGLSMGSFISFLLLQQQGLSMGSLYAAYFVPFFFTVGMVVVRRYSANEEHSTLGMIRRFFCDPISIAPNLGILAGLTANFLSGGHRPEALKPLATGLLLTTVSIYSVGIGLSMRFGRIARFWRDCLGMSFVKFVAAPLIGLSVGLFLGCHEISGGLALKVVLIQSSMPVAIFALVMCKLFDLDMDVANSCWLFTTLATVGVFLALRAVVPAI